MPENVRIPGLGVAPFQERCRGTVDPHLSSVLSCDISPCSIPLRGNPQDDNSGTQRIIFGGCEGDDCSWGSHVFFQFYGIRSLGNFSKLTGG